MNAKRLTALALAVLTGMAGASGILAGASAELPESEAGPDGGAWVDTYRPANETAQRSDEKLERLLEDVTASPETLERIPFGELEGAMRSRNLQILSFDETADYLNTLDYDKLSDDMRKQLNAMATAQYGLVQVSGLSGQMMDSYAYGQLEQGYAAIRTQFDAIKDGNLQRDNAGTVRQLRNYQDQLVMGAETLYIALSAMETQKGALERQLAAMNRTVEEMELRYSVGQISALQLSEIKTGRSSLASGLETLKMNLRTYKMRLETMLGATPTGELIIGPLPEVTEEQLSAMDVERDLADAMGRSYELFAAARTLEDQREAYSDAGKANNFNEKKTAYQQAIHTWNAARNTYNAALQNYELRFRTLCEQVADYYQIWNASRQSLSNQEASFQASELKYQQGTISKNAYLAAQDDLRAAEETVANNAGNLFSAYNNYCWAVQHGILNG